jgi:prepilin-type processing-associated H-X9-DG protein
VALLIALLLPALQGARRAAQQVACSSNFRQFGIALATYQIDYESLPMSRPNQGVFASSNAIGWFEPGGAPKPRLISYLTDYMGGDRTAPAPVTTGSYKKVIQPMVCPALDPQFALDIVGDWMWVTLNRQARLSPTGPNNAVFGFRSSNPSQDLSPLTPSQLDQVQADHRWYVQEADQSEGGVSVSAPFDIVNFVPTPQHVRTRNRLFFDGHVEALDLVDSSLR